MNSNHIQRIGDSHRWSDVVIYNGTARWVEVASDMTADVQSQIAQVLQQIEGTLEQIGSDRHSLLEIMIHLAHLTDAVVLNELWDAWVPRGHAPIRACVQSGLAGNCRVEMIIHAAVAQH